MNTWHQTTLQKDVRLVDTEEKNVMYDFKSLNHDHLLVLFFPLSSLVKKVATVCVQLRTLRLKKADLT